MEHDVNDPAGFAALMREREGGEAPESQEQEEVTPAAEEAVTPPAPPEEAAPEGEEEKPAGYEDGYAKALGEQSEKLGAERARAEAAEERLKLLEEQGQETPAPVEINEATWERLENLYEQQGGAGMMLAIANAPDASEDLLDAGIALWKENDYRNAELYEKRVDRMVRSVETPEAPPDPQVESLTQRQANQDAMAVIASEHGREKLETLQPYLEPALQAAPARMREMLSEDFQSADKDKIAEAFRVLVTLAEPLAAAATAEGGKSVSAKRAATVASGSQARSSQGQSELPSTREEFEALPPDERKLAAKKLMTQRLLGQDTSVANELAKNQAKE